MPSLYHDQQKAKTHFCALWGAKRCVSRKIGLRNVESEVSCPRESWSAWNSFGLRSCHPCALSRVYTVSRDARRGVSSSEDTWSPRKFSRSDIWRGGSVLPKFGPLLRRNFSFWTTHSLHWHAWANSACEICNSRIQDRYLAKVRECSQLFGTIKPPVLNAVVPWSFSRELRYSSLSSRPWEEQWIDALCWFCGGMSLIAWDNCALRCAAPSPKSVLSLMSRSDMYKYRRTISVRFPGDVLQMTGHGPS